MQQRQHWRESLSCAAANLALTIHSRDFSLFFPSFHSGSLDLYSKPAAALVSPAIVAYFSFLA